MRKLVPVKTRIPCLLHLVNTACQVLSPYGHTVQEVAVITFGMQECGFSAGDRIHLVMTEKLPEMFWSVSKSAQVRIIVRKSAL